MSCASGLVGNDSRANHGGGSEDRQRRGLGPEVLGQWRVHFILHIDTTLRVRFVVMTPCGPLRIGVGCKTKYSENFQD